MNESKEALRIEILKYLEKHSRVDLGELAALMGTGKQKLPMRWRRWKRRRSSAAITR